MEYTHDDDTAAPDPRRSLAELGLLDHDDIDAAGDLGAAVSRAATKPLRRLGVGELYTLLRLNLAMSVVVPLTMERLADAPYVQAQDYPGDLLTALLESDSCHWLEHRDQWEEMIPIVAAAMEQAQVTSEEGETTYAIGDSLGAAVLHFMGHHTP